MPTKVITLHQDLRDHKVFDAIREGDIVMDAEGIRDEVTAVDKHMRSREMHYYISRRKYKTLLFILPL
ncbi:hypothetical protein ASE74_04545 [Pedobacter sp. Leaf216]|uniref:hypothetical protein n=1 Tax=Pedobacter sp. Leaf216 TaxID=1735684 RepID=UPI0006FE41B0|nr:hypothetical protein [Pedobacter sp. Leaf216]KQM69287.1 hypothetical protein ASE74_04545 [Pedobacter sp. Leaf216]